MALLTVPLLVLDLAGWPVTVSGLAGLALIAVLALGIAEGRLPTPASPIRGVNIVAGGSATRVWLVAHSDSKSQGASLAGRVMGSVVAMLGAVLLSGVLLARIAGPLPVWMALAACAPALVGGAVLSFSRARNESPGAVDNATGVIAALTAAAQLSGRSDIGVIITDAEELGLEGARAWVATMPRSEAAFVNFDGLDDRGSYRVMPHAGHAASSLARVIAAELGGQGGVVVQRLPPGVLVDGIVLARYGLTGVSVSRGDFATLRVVHTARDGPERVSVASAVAAGRATAQALGRWLS